MARRPLLVTASLAIAGLFGAVASSACSSAPIETPVRSLQSSGPVSFVCLGDPDDASLSIEDLARPLRDCGPTIPDEEEGADENDFSSPHLYAMVTQPNSGQVAVVDLSVNDLADAVTDANPASPGKNFLPIGALPTDIVSTPGSTATLVGSAEPGYERLYALPSNMVRGGAPRLTSWPACALPAAPGELELVVDPPDGSGAVRPTCDSAYGDPETGGDAHPHGDLGHELAELGTPGRLKLLVTLPSEGGIGVVDVQDLLDRESGTSDPCVIERWLPLEVELTPPPPPPPPQGEACVPPETGYVDPAGAAFEPMPDGVALAGGRLYVADRNAPVIHRLQVDDPCDPHEIPPLVTSSAEDPLRVVVTSEVAVSPLTLDLRRFLYAVDLYDGSIMVYDVSDEGGSTRPLERPNAATNPFQPRDRLFFGSPPRELVTVRQQRDDEDPVTGSTVPLRCDPDPEASGPATEYRTTSDYSDAGASPFKLRGVFTLAVLESGEIFVLDVDDFDAPCRGPQNQTLARGCEEPLESGLVTSDEYSCRTVSPHEPRAGAFLFSIDGIADREPGVNAFPLLFSSEGTVIQLDAEEGTSAPRMRALTGVSSRVRVGSSFVELDTEGLAVGDPTEHTLVMNLADPRAHIVDQDWTVTYEGGLPGFGGRFAELVETEAGFTMTEPTSSFCGRGVQSLQALADRLAAPPPEGEGLSEAEAVAQASPFADYVQIFSDFPVESDGYWDAQSECTFNACNAVYGSTEAPREARDLRIVEAYQDALELEPRVSPPADAPRIKCCLPGVVEFRVRPGRQWTVVGSTVRFLHRMTTAEDGTCRPSCDPISALENARVREAAAGASVSPDDPAAFINPFFQLAINAGDSQRDMQFRFTTKGSFEPLVLTVRTEETADIQPSAATFLSLTGELVVSDGSLQGITFIDLDDLRITRQLN